MALQQLLDVQFDIIPLLLNGKINNTNRKGNKGSRKKVHL